MHLRKAQKCGRVEHLIIGIELWLWCLMPLSTIFQLYRGGQFIGGGNWSTLKKLPLCHQLLIRTHIP